MSRENVEIARAFFETWNAGDMDAFRELYDPDVIVRTVADWPEPGPYVGREAVMRFHEQLRETWDADTGVPISDFIDAGDRVAVRYVWRGAGQGPDLNMELTLAFTMRKGRIFYLEFFWNHADALEAVGLSEQDAHADSS
jgi:ketosteroid isomerase-like protein